MIVMTGRMPVIQNPAYRPTRLAFAIPTLSCEKLSQEGAGKVLQMLS